MTAKKCIECNQDIALYWKDLERANFCYECFAKIMGEDKHDCEKTSVVEEGS